MNAFKSLVKSDTLSDTCRNAYELIQLLRLGKIEQGSVSSAANFKSLNARWFGVKATMKKTEDTCGENSLYIERDSLVKMKYKRGGDEVIRFYQVLCIFSKHYNKWFVHLDDSKVPFVQGSKKYKILARMMEFVGVNEYKEVKLEKTGEWSPKAVYRIGFMADILSVETKLESEEDWWGES